MTKITYDKAFDHIASIFAEHYEKKVFTFLRMTSQAVSLRSSKKTAVENTIFISTKGYRSRYSARIKITIDPPDAFTPTGRTASMSIADFRVTGKLSPHLEAQAKQFIVRNREVLLAYWNLRIDTAQLIEQLQWPLMN